MTLCGSIATGLAQAAPGSPLFPVTCGLPAGHEGMCSPPMGLRWWGANESPEERRERFGRIRVRWDAAGTL